MLLSNSPKMQQRKKYKVKENLRIYITYFETSTYIYQDDPEIDIRINGT